MTKEITKSIILQEIQDKLALREFEPEKFTFSENVIPTYDIGQHLRKPELKTKIQSITGTGSTTFFIVPHNQEWILHGYNVIFITGVYTIAGVMLQLPSVGDWIYLDLAAAQNTSYANLLSQPVRIQPDEDIAINVDGYTSTGNLELRALVTVEEIR